jgi:hypothetical protein
MARQKRAPTYSGRDNAIAHRLAVRQAQQFRVDSPISENASRSQSSVKYDDKGDDADCGLLHLEWISFATATSRTQHTLQNAGAEDFPTPPEDMNDSKRPDIFTLTIGSNATDLKPSSSKELRQSKRATRASHRSGIRGQHHSSSSSVDGDAGAEQAISRNVLSTFQHPSNPDTYPSWLSGLRKPLPQPSLDDDQNELFKRRYYEELEQLIQRREVLNKELDEVNKLYPDKIEGTWVYERFDTTREIQAKEETKKAFGRGMWKLVNNSAHGEVLETILDEYPVDVWSDSLEWIASKPKRKREDDDSARPAQQESDTAETEPPGTVDTVEFMQEDGEQEGSREQKIRAGARMSGAPPQPEDTRRRSVSSSTDVNKDSNKEIGGRRYPSRSRRRPNRI